jgi:septal ring factor EnvC (AmiA/AmiB activator)
LRAKPGLISKFFVLLLALAAVQPAHGASAKSGKSAKAKAIPAKPAQPSAEAERLKELEKQAAESKARAAELAAKAAQAQKELDAQRQALTGAAAEVRKGEQALTRLEGEQTSISSNLGNQAEMLGADQAKLARLTLALVRLARIPPGGLLSSEDTPIEAGRAEILIQSALEEVKAGAEREKAELARLGNLNRELDAKRDEAQRAAGTLKQRQMDLAQLVQKRQAIYQQTDADRKAEEERARKIADEAKDLRDLVARIEAQQKAEQAAEAKRRAKDKKPAAAPRGHFVAGKGLPVAGQVKIRFGQNDGLGTTSHGITIVTRAGATVTAPASGTVRFAGPFRSYREILILEHPGGYLSLIAGMERVNAAVGASVGAGEPIGTMDDRPDARPELYYELRRSGQFIDPETVASSADAKGRAR